MYLADLREQASQGDIFEAVPIVMARSVGAGDMEAHIRLGRAILLSHDCEYDKPSTQSVIVAEIRPLEEIQPGSRGNVRLYRTRNTFYLESCADKLPESYVDLRRISRVEKDLLERRKAEGARLISLTDTARDALQRQIAIFFGYGR